MMKNYLKSLLVLLLVNFAATKIVAQNSPFNCVEEAYLFQNNDVYSQNLASGNAVLDGINITPANINGVGYNSVDGYIWGSLKSPANTLVRIGANYQVDTYTVANAPFSYVGDVHPNGTYYLKSGGDGFYKVDLDPASPTYLTNTGTGTLSRSINCHDWAFNAADNMLYTVEKGTNLLCKIDPATGVVQEIGIVPILSGLNYTYGAVYFDVDGNFYVSANQTGTVYIVRQVQNLGIGSIISSNLFAYGPSSSSNDGARCPTAPVPQEDCTNGVDDDGDGLVDCDDPSCSGVAVCPVFSATSSGNDGGLESNNRLSQQISYRNFSRVKNNYKFSSLTARRVVKPQNYAARSSNMTLWDFIPMDVLENAQAVESSPSDLVDITNAVDVVSVDYVRDGASIGTLLALQTENSVYEHTKHICDRFTGAELLSVSNMEINENIFLKSVVKKPDGSQEFVASFSARLLPDNNFSVESHWNLDKFTQDSGFYNFQIWASTIDDLYKLAEEVLRLVEVQKPITSYNTSEAPPVFVRKVEYNQGAVHLDIVNIFSNVSTTLEGYKRNTETGSEEFVSQQIELNEYLNHVTFDAGALYDFGFRLSNQYDMTPDDVFVSDGTWGLDYSSQPYVSNFNVSQNAANFDPDVYGVERNFAIETSSNQDISVYRSLTPKFSGVDLSSHDAISFNAKGTGKLKVMLVKESIEAWENQMYTIVDLTENSQNFIINKNDFVNANEINDVKMIFFTLVAESNQTVNKTLEVTDVLFRSSATAGVEEEQLVNNKVTVSPNPMASSASFSFNSDTKSVYNFEVYDLFGKRVFKQSFEGVAGRNSYSFNKRNLSSGMYFFSIQSSNKQMKGKFLIK